MQVQPVTNRFRVFIVGPPPGAKDGTRHLGDMPYVLALPGGCQDAFKVPIYILNDLTIVSSPFFVGLRPIVHRHLSGTQSGLTTGAVSTSHHDISPSLLQLNRAI
jgi:hypothetical protein